MEKTPNPEPQLVTMRCPCDDPNPCCSETITSPKGLITILFWDCQAFSGADKDQELSELRDLLNSAFEDDEDDETP